MDATDKRILDIIQTGFPIAPRPYEAIGREVGLTEAEALARLMIQIGEELGRHMAAVISDMNQPLGRAVGNALEVREAIATLHGQGPADFTELALVVAAAMVRLYDEAHGRAGHDAHARVVQQLESGAAWQKFRAFIAAQGGDLSCVDEPERLPQAPVILPCPATTDGYVAAIDTEEVGMTIVDLGGGRLKKGDPIDPAVGLELAVRLGDWVTAGQPLAAVHAATAVAGEAACRRLQQAIRLQPEAVPPPPLIHMII